MIFEQFIKEYSPQIEEELGKILLDFSQRYDAYTRLKPFISSFVKANRNGKRIRGLLVLLGYELSGRKVTKEVITLAALYEIIQTGLLIHDDIIDKSETRRNKKSLYEQFGRDHFAISQGISLGDLGFFFSEEILSTIGFSDAIRNQIQGELNTILSQTAIGQLLDVSFSKSPRPTEGEILTMMYHKTAVYTFIGPLTLGVLASGEKPSEKLKSFGKHAGIAFQMQDDLLGVFADKDVVGKSTTSDIKEGKQTLLYFYAIEKSDEETRNWLIKRYGDQTLKDEDINTIKDIFNKTNAKQSVEIMSENYFSKAINNASEIGLSLEKKKLLESLIDFIKSREK